jgi:hypothetical protein
VHVPGHASISSLLRRCSCGSPARGSEGRLYALLTWTRTLSLSVRCAEWFRRA